MKKLIKGGDSNHMAELYRGNCLDVLKQLIDEKRTVQAIITDPPYG